MLSRIAKVDIPLNALEKIRPDLQPGTNAAAPALPSQPEPGSYHDTELSPPVGKRTSLRLTLASKEAQHDRNPGRGLNSSSSLASSIMTRKLRLRIPRLQMEDQSDLLKVGSTSELPIAETPAQTARKSKRQRRAPARLTPRTAADEPSFECDLCGKSLSSAANLKTHLILHQARPTFKCDHCDKSFYTEYSRDKHVTIRHSEDRQFACGQCGSKFKTSASLTAHLRAHSFGKQYVCKICGKGYKYRIGLSRHVLGHGNLKPYACPNCDKRFKEHHHAKRHIRLIHKCMDDKVRVLRVLEQAQQGPVEEELTKEQEQDQVPLPPLSIDPSSPDHVVIEAEAESNVDPDSVLGTALLGPQKSKTVICHLCGKTFKSSPALSQHVKKVHSRPLNFECDLCDLAFSTEFQRNAHRERAHSKSRIFKCDQCSIGFKTRGGLDAHQLAHSDLRRFTCRPCGKEYKHKSGLNLHQRVHHNSRGERFQCHKCPKVLFQAHHLKRHLGVHEKHENLLRRAEERGLRVNLITGHTTLLHQAPKEEDRVTEMYAIIEDEDDGDAEDDTIGNDGEAEAEGDNIIGTDREAEAEDNIIGNDGEAEAEDNIIGNDGEAEAEDQDYIQIQTIWTYDVEDNEEVIT